MRVARAFGIDYRMASAIIRKEKDPSQYDISTIAPEGGTAGQWYDEI